MFDCEHILPPEELDDYLNYQNEVLRELREEADGEHVGGRQIEYIEFISRSAGRNSAGNRIPRKPKSVAMLQVDESIYPIKRGELRNSRNPYMPSVDSLAEEVLGTGATPDDLVEMARRRSRRV